MLRHFDDEPEVAKTFEPAVHAAPAETVVPESSPVSRMTPEPAAPVFVPKAAPAASPKVEGIEIPLQPILAVLPLELRAKVTAPGASSIKISIPVEKILSQLATGSVKISFGELRQLAPRVFANYGGEHDARTVALPLNHILTLVNPTLLARRSAQKKVEISDEVASPFDTLGGGLKIPTEKPKAPAATPPAQPVPLSRFTPPVSEAHSQPPPVIPPPAFTPRWTAPATNGNGNGNGAGSAGKDIFSRETNGSNGVHSDRPSAPEVPLPMPAKTANVPQSSSEAPLLVPLAILFENWPDALKLEISQLDLDNAQVALPVKLVEPALKRGRVTFTWRDLRSWIKSAAVAISVHDNTELELPLKVLAPLFFARQKNGAPDPKKQAVSEAIPDMFFGSTPPASIPPSAPTLPPPAPEPSVVAAAIPKPDTNFYTRSIHPPTSDSEFKRKGGTDFKSRGATPSDIVTRAMELPGVAGAVIALADGLKVASQIPADLNGDTLAAFIPQIFARVNYRIA